MSDEKLIVESSVEIEQAQIGLVNVAAMNLGILLQDLYQLIQDRKEPRPEGSYTTYLFNSGLDKILKKVGEDSDLINKHGWSFSINANIPILTLMNNSGHKVRLVKKICASRNSILKIKSS